MTKNERLSITIASVSAVAAIFAAFFALNQAQTAKEANDRQSGRVVAKLQIVGVHPKAGEFPELLEPFLKQMPETKSYCVREPGQLLFLNPRIIVKNIGEEPIDSIRVETKFVWGLIDAIDKPVDQTRIKDPFVLRQAERDTYDLSRKFKKGEMLVMPFAKGLLGQMIQAQNPAKGEWKHSGRFEVRCFARMVGSTSFDGGDTDEFAQVTFWWYPNGFPEDKVKAMIEKMQPEAVPYTDGK
jgi:hypothetical protein